MRQWTRVFVGFIAVVLCLLPVGKGEAVTVWVHDPTYYYACNAKEPRKLIEFPVVAYLVKTGSDLRVTARAAVDNHRKAQGLPAREGEPYTEEDRAYIRSVYPATIPYPLYLGYLILHEDSVQFVRKTDFPCCLGESDLLAGKKVPNPPEDPWIWLNVNYALCIPEEKADVLFPQHPGRLAVKSKATFGLPPQDDYVPVFQDAGVIPVDSLLEFDGDKHTWPEYINELPGMKGVYGKILLFR